MFFTFFKPVQMVSNHAKHHKLKTKITTTSTFKYVQNTFRWRLQSHMYVLYAFNIDYVKTGTVLSANSMALKPSYFALRSTRCCISRKCVSLWICKTVCLLLSHLFQMHPFFTPWKHQKTLKFSYGFRGVERVHWVQIS